jgi:hypothetical protein
VVSKVGVDDCWHTGPLCLLSYGLAPDQRSKGIVNDDQVPRRRARRSLWRGFFIRCVGRPTQPNRHRATFVNGLSSGFPSTSDARWQCSLPRWSHRRRTPLPLAADGNRSGGLLQEGPGFALGDAARWGHRRLAPATWRTGVASPSFCRPLLHPEFRVLDARADAQRPPPRAPRSLTRM